MLKRRIGSVCSSLVCGLLLFMAGCVTQTERISPHERIPQDESVWEELRREFGWGKTQTSRTTEASTEPFYQRAAQGVKATLTEWFRDDPAPIDSKAIEADRRRFDLKREAALQRLQTQEDLE
ncbi:MAG: hypothetical protein HYZ50_15635 [Deltaproteobacteria bacterium]|nr:hypothetical protein [Deltaproteobacteria bacterium]